ncbi:hypothetical protein Tco_1484233 [Tanacetum coccineum]
MTPATSIDIIDCEASISIKTYSKDDAAYEAERKKKGKAVACAEFEYNRQLDVGFVKSFDNTNILEPKLFTHGSPLMAVKVSEDVLVMLVFYQEAKFGYPMFFVGDIRRASMVPSSPPGQNSTQPSNACCAKKQLYVAMSSAKAEYVAAAGCCANILWMKSKLTNYDIIYKKVPIFCDNTSAIAISNNPVLHSRTKHIDIRYHFIRDHILKGDIELHFIPTQYQLADIFTKPLDEPTFKRLIVELDQISKTLTIHSGETSSHNTSSPEINPKEEPVTQVEFTFEEIGFTTNNKVALLYPSHPNQEYLKDVSDFISKCCLKEAFTRAPTQYKEYVSEFWYMAKTLEDSKVWVSTPTGGVRGDISEQKTREKIVPCPRFISLLLEHMMPEYDNKELTINPTQVFSVHNWTLEPNQPEEPPFTTHIKAISKLDVLVVSKAPKPSSQTEEVPQGKKPRAKSGLRRKQSSKHTSESQTEAYKTKSSQSKTETKSSLAKDKHPSHLSPPILVVGEMHKEAQQAAGGLTYLGANNEEGAHPQLNSGHDASADSTAEADPGSSAPNDSISS